MILELISERCWQPQTGEHPRPAQSPSLAGGHLALCSGDAEGPRNFQFPFSKVILIGMSTWASKAPPHSSGMTASFWVVGGICRLRWEGGLTWYPQMCCIRRSHMTLLVRTKCRTFTAAYMLWSSVAKEMRPRRMAGPPMKSRLLAAGLEWNTLTPGWDKDFPEYTTASLQWQFLWQHARAVRDIIHLQLWGLCTGQAGRKSRGFKSFRSLRDPVLSPFWVIEG